MDFRMCHTKKIVHRKTLIIARLKNATYTEENSNNKSSQFLPDQPKICVTHPVHFVA